ncbi:MAG: SDR family oxidoreductase [Pontixanthobacter sp.]
MTAAFDFSGKRALVVGGSSGIGNGIARAFQASGAEVTVWGTRPSAADYDAAALDGFDYAQVDMADREAIDGAHLPDPLDIVVLSQGQVKYSGQEFEPEGWDEVVGVNLTSVMDVARRVKPLLERREESSLITISSVSAYAAAYGNPAYGASKAGVVALTRALAVAWARDGIRVNGIAPGFVRTKMTDVTFDGGKREKAALQSIPLGRTGAPEELANAALFLASPMASYILGQTIAVDGGLMLT